MYCSKSRTEFKKRKKSKHWANILNFWQRTWTAWISMTLWVINSDSFCYIRGSYIFIYHAACVRLSRLDGLLKNVLLWNRVGQGGCHVVICVAPTRLCSLKPGDKPGAAALRGTRLHLLGQKPWWTHEFHNSRNSQLSVTILIAKV